MTANKPMTGEQLDELMTVAVNFQRDSEKAGEGDCATFAYAVQVAVLEIREVRSVYEELQSKNADLAVQLANAESKCRELAAENEKQLTHSEALAVDNAALREVVERMVNQFAMSGISPEEKSINPAKSLMFDAKSALFMPATDAFLAEVRAQGVEMYADNLDSGADDAERDGFDDAVKFLRSEASGVRLFAAQLRKGAAL
ncbi:hypothetical protein [Citrobacter sp. wls718]|uniref:hypothetical protein n=1 Tax=Citrobacter sp. wls718 TaxID=2576418 RepID=UPI000E0724A4|nr:hypothetical protein [Citrobacter sp. wls718]STE16142.1 Uncharacterised protein [Escherichia coli]